MTDALKELKHSITLYMAVSGGPTPQLAVFLVKLVDFIEDTDIERKNREMLVLSYAMAEAIALMVFKSIEAKCVDNANAPASSIVKQSADQILVAISQDHKSLDKVTAKNRLLATTSAALKQLTVMTNQVYHEFTDSNGNKL